VWSFLAYALDAVAIAAQTITGTALGAGDAVLTRQATDRMVRIGLVSGVVTGIVLALVAPVLGPLFTDDPEVIDLLGDVLLVAALFQPLAGVVFVLDGVLIGAGDGRYLAWAGTLVTALFLPAAVLVARGASDQGSGLVWLWVVFGAVFIGGRAVVLVLRARTDRWMVLGGVAGDGGSSEDRRG
jgi:Na+-driven multidrug efflux pump